VDNEKIQSLLTAIRRTQFQTLPLPGSANLSNGISNGVAKAKHVYPLGLNYAVKYYFAGAIRLFHIFPDALSAHRFADLLIRRFADLRQRKKQPLTDCSFNLSPGQVARDTEGEPEIVSLLFQLHALAPEPKPFALRSRAKKTARQQFDAMRQQIADLTAQVTRIQYVEEALFNLRGLPASVEKILQTLQKDE
jgi:hypothetical protein